MFVHNFLSSTRVVRTLQEIDPEYVEIIPYEIFKEGYERELSLRILSFLKENLQVRSTKANFLRNLRENMVEFKDDGSKYFLYVENSFPQSLYYEEINGRVQPRKNIAGFIPKTNRDFGSSINPALSIFPKILNSYNVNCLLISVTPLGLIPYEIKTLEPLVKVEPFSIPNIFDYSEVERSLRYSKLRAELMGKTPPKDFNLDALAFSFHYNKKLKPIYWRDIEKKCSKIMLKDFTYISNEFIKNNTNHKAILCLSQKPHLKNLREILKRFGLYDEEFDLTKKLLERKPGDEEYMMWGISSPYFIGQYSLDINNVRRYHMGMLERIIRKKINSEKIEVVYGTTLTGERLKDKKLLKFFENWLDTDIDSITTVYATPVPCKKGSIVREYNDEEFCSKEEYIKWRERQKESDIWRLEEYVDESGIQPWTGIIQLIQSKIEEELYPPKLMIREINLESSDYHFSYLTRTPVENILKDDIDEEIKNKRIITKSGKGGTIEEFGKIGSLIHDCRRYCSISCHDFTKFTEVPLELNVSYGGYKYKISGISDIILETGKGKLHVCNTKLEASYFPPRGQRMQVLAEALAAMQLFKKELDSVSLYYHTSVLREGILFVFFPTQEQQQKILNEIGKEVYDYFQMKENPKLIPEYFSKYKRWMKDPELVKKIIEKRLNITF